MNTEPVVETPADEMPAVVAPKPKKSIKTIAADGTISYGLKKDGTPRGRPGRKPKSISQ